jgi:hypothetical protein
VHVLVLLAAGFALCFGESINLTWLVLRGARRKPYQFYQEKSRTGLRADTFNSLISNTFNMLFLHEMDCAAFVELWEKEGLQIGTTKEGMQSKLCRRLCAFDTDTFLYKN